MYMGWDKIFYFLFFVLVVYKVWVNNKSIEWVEILKFFIIFKSVLYIQKLGTAINQTPISSIGRKAPLLICMHVAYECKMGAVYYEC